MEQAKKSDNFCWVVCLLLGSSVLAGSRSSDHTVKCGYKFNRDLVHITCYTSKNLPQVGCVWYIFLHESTTSQRITRANTSEYAKDLGNCETTLKQLGEGLYTASLIITSTKTDWKQIGGNVSFNIKHKKSPTLKVHNALRTHQDSLVQVGENITLLCYENESVPLPYNISITCGGFEIPTYKQHEHKAMEGMSSVVIKLNNVMDRVDCMCEAYHISSPHPSQTSKSFSVFSPPLKPTCSYSFFENVNAEIVCTTPRVYPSAKCTWWSPTPSDLHSENSTHLPVGSDGYMSTTCSVKLKLSTTLNYTVHVRMFPDVNGADLSTTSAVTSEPIAVVVDIPKKAPVFQLKSGRTLGNHFPVVDQENVTVVCTVYGGQPMVHETHISCDKNIYGVTSGHSLGYSNGSEASIDLQITKRLHQMSCTCSANHVSQAYNVTSTFTIDVQSQAMIDSFQFLPYPPHGTAEYTPGSQLILWCNVSGRPVPQVELKHTNDFGDTKFLKQVTDHFTNYSLTASCKHTGIYACTAFNNLTHQAQIMEVTLKVKWKKVTRIGKEIYKASFDYSDKTLSKGLISLNIQHLNISDLGNYTLQVDVPKHGRNTYSIDLNFTLSPEGPPLCPHDVRVRIVSGGHAVLTWRPGFDGGLVQKFIVLSRNGTTSLPNEVAVVNTRAPTQADVASYNLTGLTAERFYVFSVQAENAKGKAKCRDSYVSFTIAERREAGDTTGMVSFWSTSLSLTVVLSSLVVAIFIHRRAVRYGPWKHSREITVENVLYIDSHLTALDEHSFIDTMTKTWSCSYSGKNNECQENTVKPHDQDSSETYGNIRVLNLNVDSEATSFETVYS